MTNFRFCFVCTTIVLCVFAAFSAIPREISFQGKLEMGGAPYSGTTNQTFRLYDVATDGTPFWTMDPEQLAYERSQD